MRRLVWFIVFVVLGLGMLACGLLIPIHLRAVDVSVLEASGRNTPSVVDQGLAFVQASQVGAAQLMARAAEQEKIIGQEKLNNALAAVTRQHPRWEVWGVPEPPFESVFEPDARLPKSGPASLTEYMIRPANRERVLASLQRSGDPLIQQLLQFRTQTNTVLFPPSHSSSGQALDAALCICGLLEGSRHFSPALASNVLALAEHANLGGDTHRFEQVLLDLTSLGQRFNWGQLVAFVGKIPDPETLRLLVQHVRRDENQAPVVFAAVQLSGNAAGVATYLLEFGQTGYEDLGASLRFRAGGVKELLARQQRLYSGPWSQQIALECSRTMPWLALTAKWLLFIGAGFLFAASLHFGRKITPLEEPLQVRGFHMVRETLFGLGFLLAVLLVTEPFLSQDSQRIEFPFRIQIPTIRSIIPAPMPETNHVNTLFMNKLTLLTMLLFFVLQALLYIACLVKLAEIRRQRVASRVQLRLLENEDHLFDAGLYLGFVGTIISLILVSVGVIKQPSLMAAYSSTSFGIIFVSIFKILHLRPARRKLLLEAEAEAPLGVSPERTARLVTS